MALSPKWSEEARKNVKETNIDDRMHERMVKQRERMIADRAIQKPQTPAPMPTIPSYAGAIRKPEVNAPQQAEQNSDEDMAGIVSAVYERLMPRIAEVVREELLAMAKEGRLSE